MNSALNVNSLSYSVEITSGPHLGQRFAFKDQALVSIGRGPENDIGLVHDPRVSRLHVELRIENGSLTIECKANKNYILINGIKEDKKTINSDCSITVGESDMKIIFEKNMGILQPIAGQPLITPNFSQNQNNVVQFQKPNIPPINSQFQNNQSNPYLNTPSNYSNPQMKPNKNRNRAIKNKTNNSMTMILVIVAVVVIGFIFISKSEKEDTLSGNTVIAPILIDEQRMKDSEQKTKQAKEQLEQMSSQKKRAYESYVIGMREFRNGNYNNALIYLSTAFNNDPTLEDASRFALKAKSNLERLIEIKFDEGKKYRENGNFRLCKSSFQIVLTYIKNNINHPRYHDSKLLFDECNSREEVGRF